MKWVHYKQDESYRVGYLSVDAIQPVRAASLLEVIHGRGLEEEGSPIPVHQVKMVAPLVPGKIVAIGLNYMDHCRETGITPPSRPIVFTKFTTSIIGTDEPIIWSNNITTQVDFEAELVAIIGQTCRNVTEDSALAYVFGYTAANDVSARDLQFGDGQWVRGKSLDTFCPLGPLVVTADEIPDPQNLGIQCLLNGDVMQDSNTREMIFSTAALISFCSHSFTLEAGDIILTGTPHGVGMAREPKRFMQNNDTVEVRIERIGQLTNPCRVV